MKQKLKEAQKPQDRDGGKVASWSPKARSISSCAIKNQQDEVLQVDDDMARALADHWRRAFLDGGSTQDNSKLPFMNSIPHVEINFDPLDFREFLEVARPAPRSSPGPDGVPYACWSLVDESILRIRHEAYLELTKGHFHHLNLALLGWSSSRKTLLEGHLWTMAFVLKIFAHSRCPTRRKRSLPARQLALNLLLVDASIEEFLLDPDSDPALVLLDIQAALPSATWGWIRFVLQNMLVPTWIIDALY